MEKSTQSSVGANTYRNTAVGSGTRTSSGVVVYDTTPGMNQNQPPPPTYDQATGVGGTTTTVHNVTFTNTSSQWAAPQGAPIQPATQYVAYATPASSSTTTYSYAPVNPTPQPAATLHIHQQQPGRGQPPVVIIQQPMLPLGPEPVYLTCPACHVQKLTRIEFEPSSRTHLMAALLCLFGLWCCVCLPYCAGSCMNTQHYCGNCGKFLGTYGNSL
ncbi:lipopolysaccharide-induced tumor necrosis factor-alpha factor homolog [Stomoxys calcitrans]|uniref:lipopolysaccharide-induced tumor necrosis factor-alpha factor homolog n=1 Tax=Stomoxys calcitrans TaxID=35570 RepID=UPI0027E26116|nr:lipopolysaccharide-induced tumor necrosis factor-alpha factor homolog [Stomoxys calcitrans]